TPAARASPGFSRRAGPPLAARPRGPRLSPGKRGVPATLRDLGRAHHARRSRLLSRRGRVFGDDDHPPRLGAARTFYAARRARVTDDGSRFGPRFPGARDRPDRRTSLEAASAERGRIPSKPAKSPEKPHSA